MTTYNHMIKVSKDETLTNSQKLHELFKDAKSESLVVNLAEDDYLEEIPSSCPEDTQLLAHEEGQVFLVRFSDNTYHSIDFGAIEDDGKAQIQAYDDFDQEIMDNFWLSYLDTEDSPMAFYHGGFIDQDLEDSFLASFPDQD